MTGSALLKEVTTVALAGWAIRQGFFKKPGVFLSWPMFNRTSYYRVDLRCDATGCPVSPWSYMIHIDYGGGVRELQEFLDYLRDVHGVTASGEGVLADSDGYAEISVRSGRVVVL
jgi:hypothetical protein